MEEGKHSSSGLEFKLHPVRWCLPRGSDHHALHHSRPQPRHTAHSYIAYGSHAMQLVMINVSDHHTRVKANSPSGAAAPVMGCLLGSQSGRVVDISNSFEIEYSMQDGKVVINDAFLARKQEQCECQRSCSATCFWMTAHRQVASSMCNIAVFVCQSSSCSASLPLQIAILCEMDPCPCLLSASTPTHKPLACHFGLLTADKQVFPKVDVLGWYVTGAAVEDAHMHIHKRVCCLCPITTYFGVDG